MIKIYYKEFKGQNAIYAKVENDDYQRIDQIIKCLIAMCEDDVFLEYMNRPHSNLPRVTPKGRHKKPIEFLAGLTAKTLKELYERDFTVKQLDYLMTILTDLGVNDIEFIHGQKPNMSQDLFNSMFKVG